MRIKVDWSLKNSLNLFLVYKTTLERQITTDKVHIFSLTVVSSERIHIALYMYIQDHADIYSFDIDRCFFQ